MRIHSFVLLAILAIPTSLLAQGQLFDRGENGISIASLSSWNNVYTSISGVTTLTIGGRIDFGLTYGILTYGGENKGSAFSSSVSYYIARGEKSRTYVALHAAYTSEDLKLPGSDLSAKGFTYGFFMGSMPKSTRSFAVLPSIGILFQSIKVNGSHETHIVPQISLSIFIPTINRDVFTIDIAYGFIERSSIYGIGLNYLFSLNEIL